MSTPGMSTYEKRPFFSITELTQFARCPRKAFYQVGQRLQRGLSPAMEYGTAIHAAVPHLLSGTNRMNVQAALTDFDLNWDGSLDDEKRNRQRASALLVEFAMSQSHGLYDLVHPSELPGMSEIKLEVQDKVSDFEVVFALAIDGLDIPLVGRIDGIGRERSTGRLKIIEFKTSSQMYGFPEMFSLNPQTIGYFTVASTLLPTLQFDGVFVHALEVHKTKNSNLVVPITVHPWHCSAFLQWARFWGGLWQTCEKNQDFPQWFTGCHPYSMFGSHGYQCEFMDLCQSTEDWTQLQSLFTHAAPRYVQLRLPQEEIKQ